MEQVTVNQHLKEMSYNDLVWLLVGGGMDEKLYTEIEVELTLRDIAIQQLQPEVN